MANGMTGPLLIWQVRKCIRTDYELKWHVVKLVAAEDIEEAKRKAIRFCGDDWTKVEPIE